MRVLEFGKLIVFDLLIYILMLVLSNTDGFFVKKSVLKRELCVWRRLFNLYNCKLASRDNLMLFVIQVISMQ